MGTCRSGITVTRLRQSCLNSRGLARLPRGNSASCVPRCSCPLSRTGARRASMRLLFGIILGAALTVGVAYISDIAKSAPDVRPMVNWDVVGENVDSLTVMIRQGWAKLTG